MRVAYVCADAGIPIFGNKGASVHVQEVLRSLVLGGAEVEVLAARVGGAAPPELEHVPVHPLPRPPAGEGACREAALREMGAAATDVLRRLDPFDLVYERYSLWAHGGMRFANETGVRALLEVNAPLIEEQADHRGLHDRKTAERIARLNFAAANAVIAVSTPVAQWVTRLLDDDPRKVVVIPNGVNTARIGPPAHRRDTAGDTCTIGFVGTLKPWHGLETLIEAFRLLARRDDAYRLLIVGEGPEHTNVTEALTASGLGQRAELAGSVSPTEIPEQLSRIDIAVAPYPASATYFSPLKLYEYLAAALPVVATAVGQVPQIIDDGRTGILCAPGDPVALAAAIERLRGDPLFAASLGEAGRSCVVAEHSWHGVVARSLACVGLSMPMAVGAGRT
jgi:glycosyltransferase involved in cell wall biosynthesis